MPEAVRGHNHAGAVRLSAQGVGVAGHTLVGCVIEVEVAWAAAQTLVAGWRQVLANEAGSYMHRDLPYMEDQSYNVTRDDKQLKMTRRM